jgi:hypothetical protein
VPGIVRRRAATRYANSERKPNSGDGGFMTKPVLTSGVIWHRSTALSIVSLQEKDEYEGLFSIPLPKPQAGANNALILGKGSN